MARARTLVRRSPESARPACDRAFPGVSRLASVDAPVPSDASRNCSSVFLALRKILPGTAGASFTGMSRKAQPPAPDGEGFGGLGLSPALLDTLAALGYEEPTPIQREAIPSLLAGRDLLGQAGTGTGKTAAFALPLLERIHRERPVDDGARRVRALILVPTRELAMQVAEAVHKYGHTAFGTSVVPVY